MQGQDEGPLQSEGDYRRLSYGAVRVHDAHLSRGQPTSRTCGLCGSGLESAFSEVQGWTTRPPEDGVDESDGGDEGGDAASSPGGWPRDGANKVLEGRPRS